ncbi:MAG: glucosaminidase domain-containing protein [Bacteroidales bacterium]|nr:glucosaminidase domain-containing protein [Candidatus Liminaster caballi]
MNARNNCPPQGPRLSAEQYCKLYAEEAQRQMQKYGIPASITLAQGMYESGYGSSYLAVVANNHFGIKAYRNWNGPVVRCDDDARSEPFCKFKTVLDGYEHHSRFLVDNQRYAPLFKLNPLDYKAWAKGLSKCGYATNPQYAAQIIDVIERYHLDLYDTKKKGGKSSSTVAAGSHQVYLSAEKRGLRYVRVAAGDDLSKLADEFHTTKGTLRKWNDLPKNYQLTVGEVIYLEAKHKKANKEHAVHVVRPGESLHKISQLYGVTVKSIVKRNHLQSGSVSVGQELKLR